MEIPKANDKYAELVKNRKLFQSFTGLRIEAFAELLAAFEQAAA